MARKVSACTFVGGGYPQAHGANVETAQGQPVMDQWFQLECEWFSECKLGQDQYFPLEFLMENASKR